MTSSTASTPQLNNIIFCIEGTALCGAYINELKTYIIPTLEFFSGGNLDDKDLCGSDSNYTLYGLVIFNAGDLLPCGITYARGPITNGGKLLTLIDSVQFCGGLGESQSHIGEALQSLQDLQNFRSIDGTSKTENHLILICNSKPLMLPVMENVGRDGSYKGLTLEQLVSTMKEKEIHLSIFSPRKIPALINLFDKSGGDNSSQKLYSKDRRHLVLLNGFSLQERALTPPPSKSAPPPQALHENTSANVLNQTLQKPTNIPVSSSAQQNQPQPTPQQQQQQPNVSQQQSIHHQQQQQLQQQAHPHPSVSEQPNIQSHQQPQITQSTPISTPVSVSSHQITGPPISQTQINVGMLSQQQQQQHPNHPSMMQYRPGGPHQQQRLQGPQIRPERMGMGPMQTGIPLQGGPGGPQPGNIAQMNPTLNQMVQQPMRQLGPGPGQHGMQIPPSHALLRYSSTPQQALAAQQQQNKMLMQQQQQQQQHQGGMSHLQTPDSSHPHQQQLQHTQGMQGQQPQQQNQPLRSPLLAQLTQPSFSNITTSSGIPPTSNLPTLTNASSPLNLPQANNQQKERIVIWSGLLEWHEKQKGPPEGQSQIKIPRQVPCQVTANVVNGEAEVLSDGWPQKLIMQLIPKAIVGNLGGTYFKDVKTVLFILQNCDALVSLTRVLDTGFAGCVHFTGNPVNPCAIKVLILLYSKERCAYLGFIPNDQAGFVDRIRKVIQQQKTQQAVLRQGTFPQSSPQQQQQIPGSTLQQQLTPATPAMMTAQQQQQQHLNKQQPPNPNLSQQQQQTPAGTQSPQAQADLVQMEMERQQNLMKIQQLQQTLEAAQQRELQFQQISVPQQLTQQQQQQQLHLQQQQIQQLQQQLQQQQQQQLQHGVRPGMNPGQQQMMHHQAGVPSSIPGQMRMMGPGQSNPGLKHLLQQQQGPPQFRQHGNRMGLPPQQQNQQNPQQSQFEDVGILDLLK